MNYDKYRSEDPMQYKYKQVKLKAYLDTVVTGSFKGLLSQVHQEVITSNETWDLNII